MSDFNTPSGNVPNKIAIRNFLKCSSNEIWSTSQEERLKLDQKAPNRTKNFTGKRTYAGKDNAIVFWVSKTDNPNAPWLVFLPGLTAGYL